MNATGALYSPHRMGTHLRGRVRYSGHLYPWVWEVWDLKHDRMVGEGGEFSLHVAMTECRKCVVAARTWWFWGGADVTEPG